VIIMSKLCKAFLFDKTDNKYDATSYIENSSFVVEFNIDKLQVIDDISQSNQICTFSNGHYNTFYDIYQVQQQFGSDSINIKVYAHQKLSNILSDNPKEEKIKSIVISMDNVHSFFQDSSFDIDSKDNLTSILFKPISLSIETNQFLLEIDVEEKTKYSHDDYNLNTMTYFSFKYKEEKHLVDVLEDIRLLQYAFSFSSNRRYNYNIIKIINSDSKSFILEKPKKNSSNPKGLFVPDHKMINSMKEYFKIIFETDIRLKKVLSLFWDASAESEDPIEGIYSKWISGIET